MKITDEVILGYFSPSKIYSLSNSEQEVVGYI